MVAFLAGGLALVGEVWHTAAVREKEADLLHVGNQYRKAIERFYLNGPGLYPRTLDELLKDPRKPVTERYLRRLYPDPITGNDEWGMVKAPDGGIMGVYSLSEAQPLKLATFHPRDQGFRDSTKYSDWRFVFAPTLQPAAKPGLKPSAPR